MSNIDKRALRERYSEKPAPKCHICGSVMTIQRAGAGSVVYGCTGRIDKDGEGYKFAEGRDFADDHYARSRVTDYGPGGDSEVLALLDELEAKDKKIADLKEAFSIALYAAGIDVPAAAGKGEASCSTITKEWLQKAISQHESMRDEIPFGLDEDDSNTLDARRIALVSLGPEPAIHRWRRVTVEPYGPYPWHYGDFIGFSKPVDGIEDEYYYSAPPASGPLVNDVTSGKPLSIKLPDISSKAFWSGTGKNEKFHPETYRRWVKEAIERSCTIARVDVEVK